MYNWYKKADQKVKKAEKIYSVLATYRQLPQRKTFVPFRGYQWRFEDLYLKEENNRWIRQEYSNFPYYRNNVWFFIIGKSKKEVRERIIKELYEADPENIKQSKEPLGLEPLGLKSHYDAYVRLIGNTRDDRKIVKLPRFSARLREVRKNLEKL